jgi:4-amino-4-deoxy-L-arabinose transferase-like glycosyltransferase
MTPDVGATALGVAACYVFWRWLKRPGWGRVLGAGVLLGLTELTKMSSVLLFGLWLLLWLVWIVLQRRELSPRGLFARGSQLGVIFLVGLYVLNLGYGFEGSFQKLGDYRFHSQALGAPKRGKEARSKREGTNRFADSQLGAVPVPLPKNYLLGIDLLQLGAVETKQPAYLGGQWRDEGWWYYYLYALAVKVPLGMWVLLFVAGLVRLQGQAASVRCCDELVLLLSIGVFLLFFSSHTSLNKHLRYVLPIFPFTFIWISQVGQPTVLQRKAIAGIAGLALTWSVASSLWVYPHSLSYFNELAGGPTGGHAHLLGSNLEWGQDLLYLRRWLAKHPEARPLHFAYYLRHLVDPEIAGIEYKVPRPGPGAKRYASRDPKKRPNPNRVGPLPGWCAVSVNKLRSPSRWYDYFLHFEPVAMAGYSIYIYHIALDEANRVRGELGLPELPRSDGVSGGASE